VTPIENPKSQITNPTELLPLSLLNDYLYCPRRAALKIVEGWREENKHTVLGDIVHEHADLPGYESQISNLPVFSDRLGLNGKCDIVEVELRSASTNLKSEISNLKLGSFAALRPVEYKKGKRRQFENDDAQLCAQALCLEEMFKLPVERGAVFHAESKRRREVEFTPESQISNCTAARSGVQTRLRRVLALSHLSAGDYVRPARPGSRRACSF
jgi:CRISPR-associated exonuclease Cas4